MSSINQRQTRVNKPKQTNGASGSKIICHRSQLFPIRVTNLKSPKNQPLYTGASTTSEYEASITVIIHQINGYFVLPVVSAQQRSTIMWRGVSTQVCFSYVLRALTPFQWRLLPFRGWPSIVTYKLLMLGTSRRHRVLSSQGKGKVVRRTHS